MSRLVFVVSIVAIFGIAHGLGILKPVTDIVNGTFRIRLIFKMIQFSDALKLPAFVNKNAISCMEYIKDSHVIDEDPVFAKKVSRNVLRFLF